MGGLTRTYLGHLPPAYDGVSPLPLVLAFHGGGGRASGMNELTHLNDVADKHGFVVVYPDGYKLHWGDGRGVSPSEMDGVDDVAFVSALIDALARQYKLDLRRVYATGISNGGFFSERLACDLSNKIAAIASVAATLSQNLADSCAPGRPVSFLLIQGTADPLVPWQGGQVVGERGQVVSAAAAIQKWVGLDGCAGAPTMSSLPDTAHDGTQVQITQYTGCQQQTEVALYLVQNGGHTWPGGKQYLPESIVGKASRQCDAGEVIWAFFQGH